MPEVRSALSGLAELQGGREPGSVPQVSIAEITGRDLVQLAGWPDSFGNAAARLAGLLSCEAPRDTRSAITAGETTLFMIGPERLWLAAPLADGLGARLRGVFAPELAVVTELGHSRTVLRIAGPASPGLLSRCIGLDLDPMAFPPEAFAQTSLRQIGVLLHRTDDECFHLYLPRSYAAWLWHWLTEAVMPLMSGGGEHWFRS